MKSTDGGTEWSRVNNGLAPGAEIKALATDSTSPRTLYAGAAGPTVYVTTDGGAHWTAAPLPGLFAVASNVFGSAAPSLFVDPADHSRIWAAGQQGVFMSEDSGASWHVSAFPPVMVDALVSDVAGTVYASAGLLANDDGFVLKLDPTGSNVLYFTFLGGHGDDEPAAITVDAEGRAYISGTTSSWDFPVAAAIQPKFGGIRDMFVTVLESNGSHLVWSTFLGGATADTATSIALDTAGAVHVGGYTQPRLYDPHSQAKVLRMKGDGTQIFFSRTLQGNGGDVVNAVAADAVGNTYVAITATSTDLQLAAPLQARLLGDSDAFVAEFKAQDGTLLFGSYWGSNGTDSAAGLAADAGGNIFLVGTTAAPAEFPIRNAALPLPVTNGNAAFVVKVSASNFDPQRPKLRRRPNLCAVRSTCQ